jgi:rifamycin polyketide synthase module 1/2/3
VIELGLVKPVDAHLRRQAAALGDKTAFSDKDRSVGYAALDARTRSLATAFAEMGAAPGQAVAVYLPNSVAWVEAALAIVRRGGVMVPISHDSSDDEVLYRLQDAGCTLVVSTHEKQEQLARLSLDAPSVRGLVLTGLDGSGTSAGVRSFEASAAGAGDDAACQGTDLDRPAFILYTSGTTGRAKGVVLTQRAMMWVVAVMAPIVRLSPDDHMLSPLPLFHSYALDFVVLGTLAAGMSTRLMQRFSTDEALAELGSGAYSLLPGVPTMFHYLLERAGKAPGPFGKLRLCLSAGAIMPGTLNAEFERRMGVPLLDGYGITETATFVTMNWPGAPRVMGSCGIPLPGLAVRIVDAATRKDVDPGGEGELIVRGPNLMLGYHDKPEETAKALVDGWYLTGDLARADANGFLTITGRLKEVIIRGGQNIAPAEIEEVVQQFPGVLDCAVVAGKHAALGEVPVLFVVAKPGAEFSADALKSFCRERLSAYKVPDSVRITDRIPRTGSGKIQRFLLQRLLA